MREGKKNMDQEKVQDAAMRKMEKRDCELKWKQYFKSRY